MVNNRLYSRTECVLVRAQLQVKYECRVNIRVRMRMVSEVTHMTRDE